MAEREPAPARARPIVVLTLAAALVAGALPRLGGAGPDTGVRIVPVPFRDLLDRDGRAGAIRGRGGALVARSASTTRAAPVCAPIDATGLGVTWRQRGRHGVVPIVEVRGEDGSWSPPVDLATEDGPDPGTPDAVRDVRGSAFLWTGASRCARVRLALDAGVRVREVAVVFVDSSGEPPVGAVPEASARAAQPGIVSREDWGADPALLNCTPSVADEVRMAFVHHTAGSNAYSAGEADDVIRGVYAYHTDGRGWCDIGYNLLVDRFGTIYEGRSGGIDRPVIGAAQMGFNTRAVSVSVMGNFERATVPIAVRRALVRVLAWRLDVAHVNPLARATMTSAGGGNTRFEAGEVVRLPAIAGHRDTGFTACPGRNLYPLLPDIRARAAARGLPKIWNPRLNVRRLVLGEPRDVRIRASGSSPLAWSVVVLGPDGSPYADLGVASGDRLDLTWAAAGPPAAPTTPGRYGIVVSAADDQGMPARAATLTFRVVAPPPSPTPTPSPSPSPTTSPTP